MTIPIVWLTYDDTPAERFGDQILISYLLERAFLLRRYDCLDDVPDGGLIVMVRGHFMRPHIKRLEEDLKRFTWVMVMVTTNETGEGFEFNHPRKVVWLQTPGKGVSASQFFPLGAPSPHIQEERPIPIYARANLCLFAGQITHPVRQDCVESMKRIRGTKVLGTTGFNRGLPHKEYMRLLADTAVAPCPAGPATPDTFRVYEATESGAIPILDSPDYWTRLFGDHHPFPTLTRWSSLPMLLDKVLSRRAIIQNNTGRFWEAYKTYLVNMLVAHYEALQ